MSTPFTETKAALREEIYARLKAMPRGHRTVESAQICARLAATELWQNARTVLLFAPMPDEPDIWPLLALALAAGKTLALPRFDRAARNYVTALVQNTENDFVAGHFGIREPAAACPVLPLNRLDLALVPGVAFDLHGGRLGRGKGYYDRLLASVPGATCGVAFDEQIVAAVPVEPHDIRLNHILTPTRWQTASPARF